MDSKFLIIIFFILKQHVQFVSHDNHRGLSEEVSPSNDILLEVFTLSLILEILGNQWVFKASAVSFRPMS